MHNQAKQGQYILCNYKNIKAFTLCQWVRRPAARWHIHSFSHTPFSWICLFFILGFSASIFGLCSLVLQFFSLLYFSFSQTFFSWIFFFFLSSLCCYCVLFLFTLDAAAIASCHPFLFSTPPSFHCFFFSQIEYIVLGTLYPSLLDILSF